MQHSVLAALSLVPWITCCGHDHDHSTDGAQATSGQDSAPAEEAEHEHNERPLGAATVGGLTLELAQGHGNVVAGGESQLVLKLPYTDQGSTSVRAWLGTEDRTLSFVGLGEYAPSHDDYDVHVTAPDPLPPSILWWFEIEKPDGSKLLGSVAPLLE